MVEQKLKNLIMECKEGIVEEKIINKTNLVEDLNFDSIELIHFIVRVEEEFDIEFDDDDLEIDKIVVFEELVRVISLLME